MLLYWIWFAELREISLLHKRRILEQLGDPEEIYKSSDWVYEKLQIPEKERRALQEKNLQNAEGILRDCLRKDIKLLPITDPAYPPRLKSITDAPILLYYKGILPAWETRPFTQRTDIWQAPKIRPRCKRAKSWSTDTPTYPAKSFWKTA